MRAEAEAKAAAVAPAVTIEVPARSITVRDGGDPLACELCLEKHVAVAAVYAVEVAEAGPGERVAELLLCTANLMCAEQHARALGRDAFADRLAEARDAAGKGRGGARPALDAFYELAASERGASYGRLAAIGALARAEDAMRMCGREEWAARARSMRRAFAEETQA